MNPKSQKWLFPVSLLIGFFIFYVGYKIGVNQTTSNAPVESELDADFSLFWDAVRLAKAKYVRGGEIKDEKILYGAIQGAVSSFGDPYSSFFNPSDAKKFEEDVKGSFGGIGAEIGMRNEELMIIAPLKNSPSEKAGLKPGDRILKVNETITFGTSVEEAVKIIRGEPGTKVTLLVMRDGWSEAKEFKITREIIQVPTLDWKILQLSDSKGKEKNILYVQLYAFNDSAFKLFNEAALNGLLNSSKGIVLDLRNNTGGYLNTAIDIAGWFLDKGDAVVKEKFREGKPKELVATGNGALKRIPVVVLVNEGSASASEILAGALRDNRGAKLVGVKTFGKGSVQELEELKDGSTLKISIAEWLTPAGHSIDKKGLEPDVKVKPESSSSTTPIDILKYRDTIGNPKLDVQLKKALEVLRGQLD